jgi:hypothetical protein
MCKCVVHKSVRALENDVRAWIRKWNEDPRPFAWTSSAEESLERLASYDQRILAEDTRHLRSDPEWAQVAGVDAL